MKDSIPETDSIQKLAEFWDSHDLTDYDNLLAETSESVFDKTKITIELESDEVDMVKRIAKQKGIPGRALIREWMIEKIHSVSISE